jgi:hypothetical protein
MTDQPARERYPDPTPEMLNDPMFDAIWNAIKGWDISRHNDGMYSGPTGNDALHILDAIRHAQPAAPVMHKLTRWGDEGYSCDVCHQSFVGWSNEPCPGPKPAAPVCGTCGGTKRNWSRRMACYVECIACVPMQVRSEQPAAQSERETRVFRYSVSQPDNVSAWGIGEACRRAADDPKCGDYIDRGLILLRELEARGFGIVPLPEPPR